MVLMLHLAALGLTRRRVHLRSLKVGRYMRPNPIGLVLRGPKTGHPRQQALHT